jgi:hypothetical protein
MENTTPIIMLIAGAILFVLATFVFKSEKRNRVKQ